MVAAVVCGGHLPGVSSNRHEGAPRTPAVPASVYVCVCACVCECVCECACVCVCVCVHLVAICQEWAATVMRVRQGRQQYLRVCMYVCVRVCECVCARECVCVFGGNLPGVGSNRHEGAPRTPAVPAMCMYVCVHVCV